MSHIKNATISKNFNIDTFPGSSCPGLLVQKEFSNYTSHDVFVKMQGNVPTVIRPSNTPRTSSVRYNHIEIKTTVTIIGQKAFVETRKILEALMESGTPMSTEAKWVYDEMLRMGRSDPKLMTRNRFEFIHYAAVNESELEANDRIYVQESDIVFTIHRDKLLRPHPNTEQGFNMALVENNESIQGYSGVFVQVVDNERESKSLFYYAGKQIVEVPVDVDEGVKSGVYVRKAGLVKQAIASLKTTTRSRKPKKPSASIVPRMMLGRMVIRTPWLGLRLLGLKS